MKKFFVLALVVVGAVACNKDQAAVNKLEGSWKATEMLVSDGGFAIDLIAFGGSFEMTFDGCKLKADEWCNVTTTSTFDGDTETDAGMYRVTDDGTTLETMDDVTSSLIRKITIVELTKTNMEVSWSEDGATIDAKLEKQ